MDKLDKMPSSNLVFKINNNNNSNYYHNLNSKQTANNNNNNSVSKPLLYFSKPTTKLEHIEDSLNNPSLDISSRNFYSSKGLQLSSSGTINTSTNSNNINGISNQNNNNNNLNNNQNSANFNNSTSLNNSKFQNNTNSIFESEQKILSLQRSISEKLRNSFKNKSNYLNLQNMPSVNLNKTTTNNNNNNSNSNSSSSNASNNFSFKLEPRKWHSERYKKNTIITSKVNSNTLTLRAANRFSTQVPLNSNQKALIAQFANFSSTSTSNNSDSNTTSTTNNNNNNDMPTFNNSNNNNNKTKKIPLKSFISDYLTLEMRQKRISTKKSSTKSKHSQVAKENLDYTDDNDDNDDTDDNDNKKTAIDQETYHKFKTKFLVPNEHLDDSSCSSSDGEIDLNNNHVNKKSFKLHDSLEDSDFSEDEIDSDPTKIKSLRRIQNKELNTRLDGLIDINRYIDDDLSSVTDITNIATGEITVEINDYEENYYYEKELPIKYECGICCVESLVNERNCCNFKACNKCINLYIQTQIKECCGNARIECLNNKCNKLIHRDEISERMSRFDKNTLNLYSKILVDANKDTNAKTCPRCSHVMSLNKNNSSSNNNNNNSNSTSSSSGSSSSSNNSKDKSLDNKSDISNSKQFSRRSKFLKNKNKGLNGSGSLTKVQCVECQLIWCFQCHAPWHDGISCSEFKKGDRMLKYWAKEVHYGQQNAQICPKCKIYIQRTKGCDHMVCSHCNSEFCYKCGQKFRSFKFVGDHYSKLSVLGCKYRFYPEKPAKRKLIRGSILGAKVVAAPFVAAVGVVVGVGVLAVGCVALPVYGSYRLIKHVKLKRRLKKTTYSGPNYELYDDFIIDDPGIMPKITGYSNNFSDISCPISNEEKEISDKSIENLSVEKSSLSANSNLNA